MHQSLLALPTDTLLNKFGSGTHAPGSGSAAALIGLLAAKLVVTVSQLTLAREEYLEHHKTISEICVRIQSVLEPQLADHFQEDAEAFDLVISKRRARDQATDERQKRRLSVAALDQLKLATAIPFRIADLCLELIDLSAKVFDIGFRGARGDTGVALSAAVAGVLSSVFVINLNLKSFRGSYWARQRRRECDQLQQTAVEKHQAALARIVQLRLEDIGSFKDIDNDPIANLWSRSQTSYSDSEIDERASAVRALVWQRRAELYVDSAVPNDPVELLAPEIALRLLGYNFFLAETLGTVSSKAGAFEVAGLLEARPGRVSVSGQMPSEVRLFTTAHELGHIILHPQLKEAHRDRPLDGSTVSRNKIEVEADKFASNYLMPANLVRTRFSAIFSTEQFSLTDETAFALFGTGLNQAQKRLKNLRGLSRMLATAERFNGKHFVSLANQFKVSATAMAIRLEELRLLKMGG